MFKEVLEDKQFQSNDQTRDLKFKDSSVLEKKVTSLKGLLSGSGKAVIHYNIIQKHHRDYSDYFLKVKHEQNSF